MGQMNLTLVYMTHFDTRLNFALGGPENVTFETILVISFYFYTNCEHFGSTGVSSSSSSSSALLTPTDTTGEQARPAAAYNSIPVNFPTGSHKRKGKGEPPEIEGLRAEGGGWRGGGRGREKKKDSLSDLMVSRASAGLVVFVGGLCLPQWKVESVNTQRSQ